MKQINQTDQQLAHQAIGLLDLTSLSNDDDAERIVSLCRRAMTPFGPVAAVCVFPRFVTLARQTLDSLGAQVVRVATVVNFPYGGQRSRRRKPCSGPGRTKWIWSIPIARC